MQRKTTATNMRGWERRRYWRHGRITDVEMWHDGRLVVTAPRKLPIKITDADYCSIHRTRIYPDLACQFCGERPGAAGATDYAASGERPLRAPA